jgi:hypothetical protein
MHALRTAFSFGKTFKLAALAANQGAFPNMVSSRFAGTLAQDEISARILEVLKGFDRVDPSKVRRDIVFELHFFVTARD